MTMEEKLEMHKQIEAENKYKFLTWKAFNTAEKILGFRPHDEFELRLFESNGYDDGIYAYR